MTVYSRPQTPPSSPELPEYKQTLSSGHVQLFVDLLKAAQAIQSAPAAAFSQVKTVNEVYVPLRCASQKANITAT